MAEVAVALAVSAITTGASSLLQMALTKKVKPTPVDRGRVDDHRFSAPGFGASLMRGYGTYRCAPVWFWDTEPVDHPVTTPGQSGGKGIGGGAPPTPETTDHYYTKSLAGAIGDKQIYAGVSRIWFNADLVVNANATTNLADTSSTRYEAEHGVLAGGANVATGVQYSNGRKVQGIGSGGTVTINCDVPTSGNYELAVAYTAATQKTFKISVNGGATVDLVCQATGGAGLVGVEVITRALVAGANTIAFSNAGASAPDLDAVTIAPALTYTGPANTDPRSFTGIVTPGRLAPRDPDAFWPVADELPVFTTTATEEGATGDGVQSFTISSWGNATVRVYWGSEAQLQDPAIVADKGVDHTPAYRGTPYIVIDNLQITAQRPLPNVTVEVQQGMREVIPILTDIYEDVAVPTTRLELSQLAGLVIGDTEGFNPGTYTPVTWTGLNNATAGANGAITKTSGANNAWNSYAHNGASIGAGTDASFRFVAGNGTFMIGFSTIITPGGSLPHPYDQVIFGVLLNLNSKPSQALKKAIQMSLGGSSNTNDVGVYAGGDLIQVEIRNGRFGAYQNGLMLAGFSIPVPTFPLKPVFAGYAIGGGPVSCSFATGADIGTEPIVINGGGLVSPQQVEAAELVVDLMTRFQFDLVEVDGVVKAVLRNKEAADITITEDELRAHRKGDQMPRAAVTIRDRNPIEIPRTVEVNFLNPQLDYHNDTADDGQIISGPQRGINSISLNLIETRTNMVDLAVLLRHKAKMEAREFIYQTGPKYIKAHKGTRIDVQMNNGNVYKTIVDSMRSALPAGVIEFTTKRHAADVFAPGASDFNIGLERPIVPNPGNTKAVFLDAPLVEPESAGDEVKPLQYVAMCGRGSGTWPGAFLLREFPLDSNQFEIMTQTDTQATIGQTVGTLPTWTDPDTKDTTSSIIVDFHDDAQIESVTEAELLANGKLNLLGFKNPTTGEVEWVQAQTATLGTAAAPFIKRYTFTNLFRGRNETIDAAPLHTSADEVVLMNSAVKVLVMTTALLGVSCDYKPLTVGQDVDDAPRVTNIWLGRSMLPHAPSDLAAVHDSSGDWYLSAVGHPREAERPESYIARVRRVSTGALMRDIPVAPGLRMAAILDHIVHNFPSGTWATSTYADIQNNNVIGEVNGTQAYVTQPVTRGTEINARLTMTAAPSPFLSGNIKLSFGPSDFTDPFGTITGAIIENVGNSTTQTRVFVHDWSTNQTAFFDVPTVNGVLFVRVVWSGTEIRWQFSGSPINPAAAPNAILKDLPTVGDSTFLRISLINSGPSGAGATKVENITIGGLSTPQTIYSLAQQENDNGGSGIATGDLGVEMWQVAPLLPNQKGLSVKGVF